MDSGSSGYVSTSFLILSRVLLDSTPRFVSPSVYRSIRPSVRHTDFLGFAVFGLTAPAQMIKWLPIQRLPTHTRLG